MKKIMVLAGVLAAGLASPVLAANATHPYQNCDKRNDNCGPTGDSQVDRLNSQQLGSPPTMPAPSDSPGPMTGTQAPMQGAPAPR